MRVPGWIGAAAAGLAATGLLTGCSRPAAPRAPFTVTRMRSPSGQAEVLLAPVGVALPSVNKLVLFMHGFGGTQSQITTDGQLQPLLDALIGAGFAVAASDAHGNNFGNPVSVADEDALARDAEAKLPGIRSVDAVGLSMGGLDALLVASDHAVPHLGAVVLLSPVCDQIPFLNGPFGSALRSTFGHRSGAALVDAITPSDPERRDPRSYAGYRYWFWHSPTDRTVPPVQSSSMVTILRSAGVPAQLSSLTGDHGDLTNLSPPAIVQFFLAQ